MIDSSGKCSVCGMVMPSDGLTLHSCGGVRTFPGGGTMTDTTQWAHDAAAWKARAERAERQAEGLAKALETLQIMLNTELPFEHYGACSVPEGFECASEHGGECDCGARERNHEAGTAVASARTTLAAYREGR